MQAQYLKIYLREYWKSYSRLTRAIIRINHSRALNVNHGDSGNLGIINIDIYSMIKLPY